MFALTPRRETKGTRMPALYDWPNEFRALYDRLFGGFPFGTEMARDYFWELKLEETDKEVVVRAEVPGFEKDEFEIEVRGNELSIKAEHKHAKEEKEEEFELSEWGKLRYERTVSLPAEVLPEKAEARYHSGVLEVRLPKAEPAKRRAIPVAG